MQFSVVTFQWKNVLRAMASLDVSLQSEREADDLEVGLSLN